jgi:RNA recognition motif-containing protein
MVLTFIIELPFRVVFEFSYFFSEPSEVVDKVAMKKSVSDLDYLKSIKATEKDTKKKPKEPKNVSYYCIKLSNLPFKAKKKDVKMFLKPIKAKSIRVPTKIHGIAYAGFATEDDRKSALKKNKSFLKDKQVCCKT